MYFFNKFHALFGVSLFWFWTGKYRLRKTLKPLGFLFKYIWYVFGIFHGHWLLDPTVWDICWSILKLFLVEFVSITLHLIFIFIRTVNCFQNTVVLFCLKNTIFYGVGLISYVTLTSWQCDNVKLMPCGSDLHLALS